MRTFCLVVMIGICAACGGGRALAATYYVATTCPPEKCYPDALTDGRSPIAANVAGANRGRGGSFSGPFRRPGTNRPCKMAGRIAHRVGVSGSLACYAAAR